MTALTVWKFDTATGAGEALGKLESLQYMNKTFAKCSYCK